MTPSIADMERQYLAGREAYELLSGLLRPALNIMAVDLFYVTQTDPTFYDSQDELNEALQYLIERGYFGGEERYPSIYEEL